MKYLIFISLLLGTLNVISQEKLSKSEASFAKIPMKKGTKTRTLVNDYGKKWKIRVNFPESSDEQNTLVIALHWAGSGETYKEFNDCLALPGLSALNTIIVSPEGESQLWSTSNNVEKILSIIENARKYWNVDPKRIAVVGYSNGGNGSWYFAEKYPELFSASIPMASSYPIKKKIDIPLYVIHGKKDSLFNVSKTKKWIDQTKKAGSTVTLIVNENLSHFQGCAYVSELKKAANWLQLIWDRK